MFTLLNSTVKKTGWKKEVLKQTILIYTAIPFRFSKQTNFRYYVAHWSGDLRKVLKYLHILDFISLHFSDCSTFCFYNRALNYCGITATHSTVFPPTWFVWPTFTAKRFTTTKKYSDSSTLQSSIWFVLDHFEIIHSSIYWLYFYKYLNMELHFGSVEKIWSWTSQAVNQNSSLP